MVTIELPEEVMALARRAAQRSGGSIAGWVADTIRTRAAGVDLPWDDQGIDPCGFPDPARTPDPTRHAPVAHVA